MGKYTVWMNRSQKEWSRKEEKNEVVSLIELTPQWPVIKLYSDMIPRTISNWFQFNQLSTKNLYERGRSGWWPKRKTLTPENGVCFVKVKERWWLWVNIEKVNTSGVSKFILDLGNIIWENNPTTVLWRLLDGQNVSDELLNGPWVRLFSKFNKSCVLHNLSVYFFKIRRTNCLSCLYYA